MSTHDSWRRRYLLIALGWFLLALALLLYAAFAADAAGPGERVRERCTITVVQPGYIAGQCPSGHFFGTATRRNYRLDQRVTVSGYLEYDGEIAYPQVTR